MFPVGAGDASISYDVPFDHVNVGHDEVPHFADLRPREAQSWVHASSDHSSVTLSSSVVAHDWQDPLGFAHRPVLQAILLATKRSCHPKGPWYTQAGTHTFSESVSGSPKTVSERMRFGAEFRQPMEVMVTGGSTGQSQSGGVARQSFLSVDQPNVMVSALKTSEIDDGLIARLWEIEGKATTVTLECAWPTKSVRKCDLLETVQEVLWESDSPSRAVRLEIGPHEIATFKLEPAVEHRSSSDQ